MTLWKMTELSRLFGSTTQEKVAKAMVELRETTQKTTEAMKVKNTAMRANIQTSKDMELVTQQLTERNAELVAVFNATRAPVDKLNDELAKLNRLYADNLISLDQLMTGTMAANEAYENSTQKITYAKTALEEYRDATQDLNKNLENVAISGLRSMEDALVDVTMGTMSVKDAFRQMAISIVKDLIRIQVQRNITGPLADALGSIFQSPGGAPTGKAIGGSVSRGSPYIVGERGPEMFIPNQSGAIVPNDKMGGGASNNIVVNVNMDNGSVNATDANRLGVLVGNVVKAELVKQSRPGGLLAA
jgi:lambda family phage tail tape measure protein